MREILSRTNCTSAYSTVRSRYGELIVFTNDTGAVTLSLRKYGEWAENEISFLHNFIPTGSTVFDIGAYIGTHTLAFARFVGRHGRVVAIEAQPEAFRVLESNVGANISSGAEWGAEGVIEVLNAIVTSERGDVMIPTINSQATSSFGSTSLAGILRYAPVASTTSVAEIDGRARVPAITVDSFNVGRCELLKIDVEGVEDLVLRGAMQTIERCSPVIYGECNSLAGGLRCLSILKRAGYKTFAHVVDAFNASNSLNIAENIFGNGREVALLAVPSSQTAEVRNMPRRSCELLLEIENADDLALALLNKPQYLMEVLRPSRAATTGGAEFIEQQIAANAMLAQLQEENTRLQQRLGQKGQKGAADQRWVAAVNEKDSEIAKLHSLLTQRDADISDLQRLLADRSAECYEMHGLLQTRDADILRLQRSIADRVEECLQLHALLANRDTDIVNLQALAADRARESDELRGSLTARDAEKNALLRKVNESLSTICASGSWKITRPLRWVSRHLKQIAHQEIKSTD